MQLSGVGGVYLPAESNGGMSGLSREWRIANWAKWTYPG
ncbi:Imm45 family immunity protein [Pseudomonas sp. LY10J]|uniref:Immunity protein 45 domain-containing protein n=1 Tax=Pseudomonas quercus TaxID=2722792 RepID=A0ABX0YBN1_9PSED|nr:hypothetical protein [Pseudomonas sp. LY10J]NJO99512.1 hypothetical protein [Pseudomonas quercus]